MPPPAYGGSGAYGGYGISGGSARPAAPKPGLIPLRPLTVGEILDGAFSAIRWNPGAILVPSAVAAATAGVLASLAGDFAREGVFVHIKVPGVGGTLNLPQSGALAAVLVVSAGAYLVARTVLIGLLSVAIGHGVLGRKETAGSAWRAARPRIGALLATVLLAAVLAGGGWVLAVGLSLGAAVLLGSVAHLPAVGVLAGLCGGISATVLAGLTLARWALAIPVVTLEHTGPVASLRRSWRLARRSSWRVFGILLLASLIVSIASGVIKVPFGLAGGGGGFGTAGMTPVHVSVLGMIISAIGGFVADTVTTPMLAGVVVLLYSDLRMRREGMDIALQAAATGEAPSGENAGGHTPGPW